MRRHETDAVSLTAGLILLGIANSWLMVATGAADIAGLRYLFPATLLVAGALGLVASLRTNRRTPDDTTGETALPAGPPA